jgi:hypothetical protein
MPTTASVRIGRERLHQVVINCPPLVGWNGPIAVIRTLHKSGFFAR